MRAASSSEQFLALNELARAMRAVRRDLTHVKQRAAPAAHDAAAIVHWVRGLPTLELEPSDDAYGDDVLTGLALRQPWPFRHRAVAVMPLPAQFADYLRGRAKQAVRTNRRRATAAGFTTRRATSSQEAHAELTAMLRCHRLDPTVDDSLRAQFDAGRVDVWFAYAPTGTPVGIATVVRDRAVAHLVSVQIALALEDRSSVRFLLSTDVIEWLIAQQCTHLLADSMLLVKPGVVYLEERLGFQATNVVVPRARRRRHRHQRTLAAAADPRGSEGSDEPVLGADPLETMPTPNRVG